MFFRLGFNDIDAYRDVADYPAILNQSCMDKIIKVGPIQVEMEFPLTEKRSFSKFYYTKKMSNGELVKREWIVYSIKLDAVHCFCCRIFGTSNSRFASGEGVNSWRHLSLRIKEHELSKQHLNNYIGQSLFAVQI